MNIIRNIIHEYKIISQPSRIILLENFSYWENKKKLKRTFDGLDFKAEVEFDKNGHPIYSVTRKNGKKLTFSYDQSLDKYYHFDVYGLECPKGFDKDYAASLKPKARREYIKKTVPEAKILEFQRANVRSLGTENFREVSGFIGYRNDPGTLFINQETGKVNFFNDRTNQWRTTVVKSQSSLIELALNDFHLFPNAVKPD